MNELLKRMLEELGTIQKELNAAHEDTVKFSSIHSNKKGATKVTPFFLYLAFPPSPRGPTSFTGPTFRSSAE
jgi:hypothetical protein